MSHAKDRARAKSGTIFRNGKLWDKEDWLKLNPTKETLAAAQIKVNEAVAGMLPYTCSKCGHVHKSGTKVYEAHKSLA